MSRGNASFILLIISMPQFELERRKRSQALECKEKKKSMQVTLKRKSGKLHSDKVASFLFIFLLSQKAKTGGGTKIKAHTE